MVAPRRAADGQEFLLYVESANNNRTRMPLRMLRYNTAIRLAGHKGRPLQFMTYIGTDSLNMPDGIAEPELLDYR